jgi:hypothetical protein
LGQQLLESLLLLGTLKYPLGNDRELMCTVVKDVGMCVNQGARIDVPLKLRINMYRAEVNAFG